MESDFTSIETKSDKVEEAGFPVSELPLRSSVPDSVSDSTIFKKDQTARLKRESVMQIRENGVWGEDLNSFLYST